MQSAIDKLRETAQQLERLLLTNDSDELRKPSYREVVPILPLRCHGGWPNVLPLQLVDG